MSVRPIVGGAFTRMSRFLLRLPGSGAVSDVGHKLVRRAATCALGGKCGREVNQVQRERRQVGEIEPDGGREVVVLGGGAA